MWCLNAISLQIIGAMLGMATTVVFNKCPTGPLWYLRAKLHCKYEAQYHCLFDTISESYIEKCMEPKSYKGRRIVYSGNLDAQDCQSSRYTPFIIWSNESYTCPLIKSLCNEEGQVTVGNGTSVSDTTCRCDYTQGYSYTKTPEDICACKPMEEDCSCYIQRCPGIGNTITRDYECERSDKVKEYRCQPLQPFRIQNASILSPISEVENAEPSDDTLWRIIFTFLICVMGFIFSVLVFYLIKAGSKSIIITFPDLETIKRWRHHSIKVIFHQESGMKVVEYFENINQLTKMNNALSTNNRVLILQGIPGSGKTQAAHYFCSEKKKEFSVVAKIVAKDTKSLTESMKVLVQNLGIKLPYAETNLSCEQLTDSLKNFLNYKSRYGFHYLLLVDNVVLNETRKEIFYLLSLIKLVPHLYMILTTYDSTLWSRCSHHKTVDFNGMEQGEYMRLLRAEEKIEASDEDIKNLIKVIGNLPIVVNSARTYMAITNKSVEEYVESFKDVESEIKYKALDKYRDLEYEEDILKSQQLALNHIKESLTNDNNKDLLEVLYYLPFLQYDSISTSVLEACYCHLPDVVQSDKKRKIDSLITLCLEVSICHLEKVTKMMVLPQHKRERRFLSFHEVTMAAISCFDEKYEKDVQPRNKKKKKNKKQTKDDNRSRNLKFLLKLFCFEIDIDARTDSTLEHNLLFLPHAKKVLGFFQTLEGESNEILFYLSHLHCAIGSTLLFQRTDVESAHIHLMKARKICLQIVKDESYFTKDICTFKQRQRKEVKPPVVEEIKTVAGKMLANTFDAKFVEEFVLHKRRGENDIDAIQKETSNLLYPLKIGCYLSKQQYEALVKEKLAIPVENLRNTFLLELLHRILHNNGRAMHELKYIITDEDPQRLRNAYHNECFNSDAICKIFKERCKEYLSFIGVECERSGRMLLHWSQPDISPEELQTDIEYYENAIENTADGVDRCFEFGILKMSKKSNDRHTSMCRRILLRYLRRKYKRECDAEEKEKIFRKGKKVTKDLHEQLKKMEIETEKYTWLSIPLLYIECAKFLQLSISTIDQAVIFFEKAINFENDRNVFWTRFLRQGYFGKIRCMKQLNEESKAKEIIEYVGQKLSGTDRENLIEKLKSFEAN